MAKATKKTAAAVAAAAPATTAAKKAPAKKAADEIYVQFAGNQFDAVKVVTDAKAAFKAAEGRKAVKSCQVYIKPEENAAYYVINGDFTGKIEL